MKKLLLLFFISVLSLPAFSANSEVLTLYTFNDLELGTEFSVVNASGKAITGARAFVDKLDGQSNKFLHVINNTDEIGYAVLALPEGRDGIYVSKKYESISLQVRRPADNAATEKCILEIRFGAKTVYIDSSEKTRAANKWITTSCPITKVSTNSKQLRIALKATNVDYYIDNIKFTEVAYSLDIPEKTIRYWADMLGKRIGTCVSSYQLNDANTSKVISNTFNYVVGENAMKVSSTEPSRGSFNFSEGDAIVSWAKKNNIKVRGHTLCWHSQIPSWIGNSDQAANPHGWTKKELLDILKNHIYGVVQHFAGEIEEWDVVNECLQDGQSGNGYQFRSNSIWQSVIGEEFIDSAFVWARRAADAKGDYNVKLFLNDYNTDSWNDGKTKALYNLAVRLKNDGIPIDGIGLQMHTGVGRFQPDGVEMTVQKCKEAGLICIVTEMDMPGSNPITSSELSSQATKYAKTAEIMAKYDNFPSMLIWGLRDDQSWLDNSENTAPLLFYPDLTPHPAYVEIRKMLQKYAISTDVAEIEFDDEEGIVVEDTKLAVYDLTGRKITQINSFDELNELPKGLYIVGGKKYMIK